MAPKDKSAAVAVAAEFSVVVAQGAMKKKMLIGNGTTVGMLIEKIVTNPHPLRGSDIGTRGKIFKDGVALETHYVIKATDTQLNLMLDGVGSATNKKPVANSKTPDENIINTSGKKSDPLSLQRNSTVLRYLFIDFRMFVLVPLQQ